MITKELYKILSNTGMSHEAILGLPPKKFEFYIPETKKEAKE